MHAHIRRLAVRRFRSIQQANLDNLGGMNVVIGKNNAGKSNLLTALHFCFTHLKQDALAQPLTGSRPLYEFCDLDASRPTQIGIELALEPHLITELGTRLREHATHLSSQLDALNLDAPVSLVIAATQSDGHFFAFLEQVSLGPLRTNDSDLSADGFSLLRVPLETGLEQYHAHREATEL